MMGYDSMELPEYLSNESNWENGYHIDQREQRHEIKDMSDSHLLATIRYFSHLDTKPLQREVKRRKTLSGAFMKY